MRSLVQDSIQSRRRMMAQLVRTLDVQDREQFHLVKSIANNMFDDEVMYQKKKLFSTNYIFLV